MGRSPCCEKVGLKKGPWTPEEDQRLLAFIEEHGHGSWRSLPSKAGLERCGKSCRLRWTNYLRPDIKRGEFSFQEEQTIIQLHALLGNRWSAIATHLPKRTDNEIKNYWNTHLKKRLAKMGIDPVTHKPKNDSLLSIDGQPKNAANLSHMAQWESARLEAEARLVRQSKLRSSSFNQLASPELAKKTAASPTPCLDILKAWNREIEGGGGGGSVSGESPTSTLRFAENGPQVAVAAFKEGSSAFMEFFGNSDSCEDRMGNSMSFMESENVNSGGFTEKFTNLLLNNSGDRSSSMGGGGDYYEDNKNYWDTLLNLVNSSPPNSPMF